MPLPPPPTVWQRTARTALRAFHAYAAWLVGISWKRFALLAVLLMILASVLQHLPPFRWSWTEVLQTDDRTSPGRSAGVPRPPRPPEPSAARRDGRRDADDDAGVTISIDHDGVRIATPSGRAGRGGTGSNASSAAAASSTPALPTFPDASWSAPPSSVAASPSSGASSTSAPPASGTRGDDAEPAATDRDTIRIELPGVSRETVREVARAAREAAREAAADARRESAAAVEEARQDADDARRDAAEAIADARQVRRTRTVRLGDFLTDLAFFWILGSAIVKATYKARVQAEVAAAAATETAEAEQLKRQVVEARMAAMQAQIEPHFLFNTLASIDHLIETDPPRASQMQKHLIALLRASMPALRENDRSARTLGREMAVIRPYLEILKVRMEDRLRTEIDVPAGLLSADFPALSIQGLVENAIKHGLEPKPEGGLLTVRAEVIDGRLAVTVADTGLGFGQAATAGTGVGLANLRERLQLLYGGRASLTIAANAPSGTVATLSVPYVAQGTAPAA